MAQHTLAKVGTWLFCRGGDGPYGAKLVGEPPIIPPAAAIANAITDAIGARVYDLPITPERVWRALNLKRGD